MREEGTENSLQRWSGYKFNLNDAVLYPSVSLSYIRYIEQETIS